MQMNETEKKLNDLALRKFQLASEFLLLNRQIENVLDNFRFNLSKTKAVVGISTTSATCIDNRDMEPSVRIDIDSEGTFSLAHTDAVHSETKSQSSEEHPSSRQFRPFGILEPQSAKAARRDVAKALALVCEIASTKCRLQELDGEYRKLKNSLASNT